MSSAKWRLFRLGLNVLNDKLVSLSDQKAKSNLWKGGVVSITAKHK